MLRREYRLRRRSDFARLYSRGKSTHAGTFTVRYSKNQLDHVRLAVVVSTKVSKKAVVRNRLRRRLYAQLRQLLPDLHPGHDIVILVRHQAIDQDTANLNRDLVSALKRSDLIR